jgi:hypothetical protein
MANALKILFGLYALYSAIVSVRIAIRFPAPILWLWAGVSLCLLPVVWGVVREKKWAWNCAAGLVVFRLVWSCAQTAGMFLARSLDKSALARAALHTLALGMGMFLVVLVLLILARRSYQTAFAAVANGNDVPTKRNSYVRPVSLGVLFLLIGLLTLMHPIMESNNPILLRLVGFVCMAVLWMGAAMCFFEREWKIIRYLAIFATVVAAVGFLSSICFYTYFALIGFLVSGLQIGLGVAAIFTGAKAQSSFVN